MIFKVLYQKSKAQMPKRESTNALYLDCDTEVEARKAVEENTEYNVEYIQALEGNHLDYEKKNPDFKITKFN